MAVCANCKHEVSRYQLRGQPAAPWCHRCARDPVWHKRNVFPFTTTHISGEPITVNSLAHARRLEREHGISFAAFNYDEKHVRQGEDIQNDLRKARPPRPKLEEVVRNPERFNKLPFGGHLDNDRREPGVHWPERH